MALTVQTDYTSMILGSADPIIVYAALMIKGVEVSTERVPCTLSRVENDRVSLDKTVSFTAPCDGEGAIRLFRDPTGPTWIFETHIGQAVEGKMCMLIPDRTKMKPC